MLKDVLDIIKGFIFGKSANKSSLFKHKTGNLLVATFSQSKDPNHQREILRREAELTHELNIS